MRLTCFVRFFFIAELIESANALPGMKLSAPVPTELPPPNTVLSADQSDATDAEEGEKKEETVETNQSLNE